MVTSTTYHLFPLRWNLHYKHIANTAYTCKRIRKWYTPHLPLLPDVLTAIPPLPQTSYIKFGCAQPFPATVPLNPPATHRSINYGCTTIYRKLLFIMINRGRAQVSWADFAPDKLKNLCELLILRSIRTGTSTAGSKNSPRYSSNWERPAFFFLSLPPHSFRISWPVIILSDKGSLYNPRNGLLEIDLYYQ